MRTNLQESPTTVTVPKSESQIGLTVTFGCQQQPLLQLAQRNEKASFITAYGQNATVGVPEEWRLCSASVNPEK